MHHRDPRTTLSAIEPAFTAPIQKRFESFDGTRVAYRLWGERTDRTPVMFCSGIACNDVYWKKIAPQLARDRLVITWDYPHHGDSGPAGNPNEIVISSLARHARAVLEDAEVERAAVAGHSMGVQVILEMYRDFRDNVAALICIAGPYARTVANLYGTNLGYYLLSFAELGAKLQPDLARMVWRAASNPKFADPVGRLGGFIGQAPAEVMAEYFDHVAGLDPVVLFEMFRAGQEHTAEDLLESIDVPVLIIHGTADVMSPFVLAQDMSERVPGATLIAVEGGAHTLPGEQPDLVVREVTAFVDSAVQSGGGTVADLID